MQAARRGWSAGRGCCHPTMHLAYVKTSKSLRFHTNTQSLQKSLGLNQKPLQLPPPPPPPPPLPLWERNLCSDHKTTFIDPKPAQGYRNTHTHWHTHLCLLLSYVSCITGIFSHWMCCWRKAVTCSCVCVCVLQTDRDRCRVCSSLKNAERHNNNLISCSHTHTHTHGSMSIPTVSSQPMRESLNCVVIWILTDGPQTAETMPTSTHTHTHTHTHHWTICPFTNFLKGLVSITRLSWIPTRKTVV